MKRWRHVPRLIGLAVFLVAVSQCASPAWAAHTDWLDVTRDISTQLDEAQQAYEAHDVTRATDLVNDAYFNAFEGAGLEAALGARSPARKADVEARFRKIRSLMAAQSESQALRKSMDALNVELQDAVIVLGGGGRRVGAFLNSLFIIVREGFEAILVITALVAFLLKSGHAGKVRTVYHAGGLALLASILTAVVIQTLFHVGSQHQENIEGVTMLLATAVLFYVSYWLTSKAEADRWQQYIREKVRASLTSGSLMALWFAAFLAVYREGAETALFYQALLASADTRQVTAITAGFATGVGVLVLTFYLLRSGAVRIPIRLFFTVTSALLYYLAFVFAGKGIRELQESGLVPATPASWLPTWDPLGLYPTWESVGLQLVLITAAAFALAYLFLIRHRPPTANAA